MTQSLPFCDPRFIRVWDEYERAVYRRIGRDDCSTVTTL